MAFWGVEDVSQQKPKFQYITPPPPPPPKLEIKDNDFGVCPTVPVVSRWLGKQEVRLANMENL